MSTIEDETGITAARYERARVLKELETKIEAYIEKERNEIKELEEEGEDEMGNYWTAPLIHNCECRIDGATNCFALIREEEKVVKS
jgi:hypothetical protein